MDLLASVSSHSAIRVEVWILCALTQLAEICKHMFMHVSMFVLVSHVGTHLQLRVCCISSAFFGIRTLLIQSGSNVDRM